LTVRPSQERGTPTQAPLPWLRGSRSRSSLPLTTNFTRRDEPLVDHEGCGGARDSTPAEVGGCLAPIVVMPAVARRLDDTLAQVRYAKEASEAYRRPKPAGVASLPEVMGFRRVEEPRKNTMPEWE